MITKVVIAIQQKDIFIHIIFLEIFENAWEGVPTTKAGGTNAV